METKDQSTLLPEGNYFPFWKDETDYKRFLYVDGNSKNASDDNPGTKERPLKTINKAAQLAVSGTKVVVKEGVYRETVKPARGGDSNKNMICYEAAAGENVIIKASVVAKNFSPSSEWRHRAVYDDTPVPQGVTIWQIDLEPDDFKGYNPFCAVNIIHDRLFIEYGKTDMTTYLNRRGMVFVDGKPLKQLPLFRFMTDEPGTYWVESNGQRVHIRLPDDGDPKDHLIELTNREQCFAPDVPFLSFIHLKGIICAHAANGGPVPQRGAISAYRGHHWIIEGCTVDWANTVAIDCGNQCWNYKLDGIVLGFHKLQGNVIRNAGVCGIACMSSEHLLVEDNLIENTGWQRVELSWEAGGIKVHRAIGALFRRNIIARSIGCDSMWIDNSNFNCRITGNLLIDGIDSREHIFMECIRNRENMIDNNIIWNIDGRFDRSAVPKEPGSSGWYKDQQLDVVNGYGIYGEGVDKLRVVNNLIGKCFNSGFYAKIVPFRLMKGRGGTARDCKFYNNIFYDCKEAAIKFPNEHNEAEGNAYSKMPFNGGFLRVLYPLPNACLDLDAWREFYGFDLSGCMSDIVIDIDSEKLEMTIEVKQELPEVKTDEKVQTDYFLAEVAGGKRVAGPFGKMPVGKTVINIDPRRYRK